MRGETRASNRFQFYLPSLLVLVILAASTLRWAIHSPPIPSYAGRSIEYWLGNHRAVSDITNETERMALLAFYKGGFSEIGTNAIPFLLSLQAAHNSKIQTRIYSLIRRQSWVRCPPPVNTHEKHMCACLGFLLLKNDSKSAIPRIIELTREDDSEVSYDALFCLRALHIPKDELYPVLLYLYQKPNGHIQNFAAYYLHRDFPERAEASGVYAKYPSLKTLGYLQ